MFEDAAIGSTVLMLFASDLDHGRNAKINYRLQSPSETFHVERDTGALVVSSTIDRESISTYILTVIFIINDQGLHTWPWLLFQIFTSIQFQLQKAIIMMRINLTIFTLIVFGSVEPRYLDNTTEKSDVSLHIF